MGGIILKGNDGTRGTDGAVGPAGGTGGLGQDAVCSGWFFVADRPPGRGGKGGRGSDGGVGSVGGPGSNGGTFELHVNVLGSGIQVDTSGGRGGMAATAASAETAEKEGLADSA